MTDLLPFCSIIVPAHQASKLLPSVLTAILESDMPRDRYELIVVDDASSDDTAAIAARYADTVIRLPGKPHGPAYARNRGFEVSRGDVVMFFDSDCVVHPDAMRRFAEVLTENPDAGAVFGAYDDTPADPGFISQYRNLLHHYTHTRNAGEVETYWAGAGAIRRAIFVEAGMYDEWHFARPQIEDIELGGRIRELGVKILLVPSIQVKHLKRWTFRGMVRTDLRDRGIPWARLLSHRKAVLASKSLNLKWTEKVNTALAWCSVAVLGVAVWQRSWPILILALWLPLVVIAFNLPLLAFFLRIRGPLFALGVIPLHLLYYLLNGVSFGFGLLLQQTIGAPLADPITEAYAEMGVQRWPPIPAKGRRSSWTEDT